MSCCRKERERERKDKRRKLHTWSYIKMVKPWARVKMGAWCRSLIKGGDRNSGRHLFFVVLRIPIKIELQSLESGKTNTEVDDVHTPISLLSWNLHGLNNLFQLTADKTMEHLTDCTILGALKHGYISISLMIIWPSCKKNQNLGQAYKISRDKH